MLVSWSGIEYTLVEAPWPGHDKRGGEAGPDAASEQTPIGTHAMKFFVDTADVGEIRDLAATGLLDGVTTNPSLVAKTGRRFLDVLEEICAIVPGPVSAEVTALDHETMLAEGRHLAGLARNIAVKVPLTPDGLKTCKALSGEGVMVNVTLCFSAAQAILAAKAGATFVSPFVGRLDDISTPGLQLIGEICQIYRQYEDSRPRCWSPRCVTRCTWSRRRRSALTSRPCRQAF